MKSVCILNLFINKMVGFFEKVREEEVNVMIEKLEKVSWFFLLENLSEFFIILLSDVMSRVVFGRKYSDDEIVRDFKNCVR